MIAACVLVLAIAQVVLAQSMSATAALDPGTVEVCKRLHVFTASSHSGGTTIEYRNSNSQSSVVATAVFQGNSLPSPSICGEGYKRCNLHITSNYDGSIRVAIFPLNSGIGLVSYDYLDTSDTLVYREQFVLTRTSPDCTYMYFTERREVVGYYLDLYSRGEPYMHSLRIGIQHDMLNRSIVRQLNSIALINLASLSNLVFFNFHQDAVQQCFPDEGGHIVCLENGEVLDHSFSGGNFNFFRPHIRECSNASRLFHVGATCKLVAHCSDMVFLFKVHQDQATVLSNGGSGQVFVCPDLRIVKFRNGTLSLHTEISTQTGKFVPFPLERIRQGDCFIVDNHYIFFTTLVDGRTLLANFTSTSYRQLGASEHAMYVPSRVEDQIGLVHNGSDTVAYDLSLSCNQERIVIPDNFILASYFSTDTRDECQCPSGTSMPVTQPTVSPTSTAANNSQTWLVPVVVVVVLVVVLVVALLIIVRCICIYKKHKERSSGHSTSSDENESQHLHSVVNPLIKDKVNAVNRETLSNGDQNSIASDSGSGCSQGTTDPLLDSERRLNSNHLPETENLNTGHQLMLDLRPESTLSDCTSETTDGSGCVLVQVPRSSRSSTYTGDREMPIGATASNNCSLYPHKRLKEIGQANTTAVQCTSPRNSLYYASAGSPPHTPNNIIVPSQGSPVNHSTINLPRSESSVSDTLHPSPVEATPDNGHPRGYLTAPQHFLASGANPHPDDIQRTHQQRVDRANEQDFRELVECTRANGDSQPNNEVERQSSNER